MMNFNYDAAYELTMQFLLLALLVSIAVAYIFLMIWVLEEPTILKWTVTIVLHLFVLIGIIIFVGFNTPVGA